MIDFLTKNVLLTCIDQVIVLFFCVIFCFTRWFTDNIYCALLLTFLICIRKRIHWSYYLLVSINQHFLKSLKNVNTFQSTFLKKTVMLFFSLSPFLSGNKNEESEKHCRILYLLRFIFPFKCLFLGSLLGRAPLITWDFLRTYVLFNMHLYCRFP
jgi:hypothetical protein